MTPDGMPLVWWPVGIPASSVSTVRTSCWRLRAVHSGVVIFSMAVRPASATVWWHGWRRGFRDSRSPGCIAAVPAAHPRGRWRAGGADQRRRSGHRLGRPGHAEAGAVDGRARRPTAGAGAGRRRGRIRFPCRGQTPGAALDAAERARMVVPADVRAAAPVASLFLANNPAFVAKVLAHPPRLARTELEPSVSAGSDITVRGARS